MVVQQKTSVEFVRVMEFLQNNVIVMVKFWTVMVNVEVLWF